MPSRAATCRVTTGGNAAGDGSWTSPMDLQSALGNPACTRIWLAACIYTPTSAAVGGVSPSERDIVFNIKVGVWLLGGFDGTEIDADERDPVANPVVLSGDIEHNDAHAATTGVATTAGDIVGSNSYHVIVMGASVNGAYFLETLIDGVTITAGNADSHDGNRKWGGGMLCYGSASSSGSPACSPTVRNAVFSGNQAISGGAMFNHGPARPTISDVTFTGNRSLLSGGAMTNDGSSGDGNALITSVTFNNNRSDDTLGGGGAMYNRGFAGAFALTLPAYGGGAVDHGTCNGALIVDQRGVRRPQGVTCDIGAVEMLPDLIFADGFEIAPP